MVSKVTIRDIANEAKTSPSTVSRVLTGNANVSQEKREAVESAIKRLNYRPSQIARSLKTSVTYSVGLLLNDITNPFYSAIAGGVEKVANSSGYSLILCNTSEKPERERQYLHVLHDKQVDGVILGPTPQNEAFIRDFARETPIVQVDRRFDEGDLPAVVVDNEEGAYRATRLLIEKGHRRIAVVRWRLEIMTIQQRYAGYQRALRDADLPLDPALVRNAAGLTSEAAAEETLDLFQQPDPPTAIFALNNQIGLGVLGAIQRLSLRIPDQIALIVFDDLDLFALMKPSISAVSQPAFCIGERAMELLIGQMEGRADTSPHVVTLETELVLRESV